jgi:HEAT repeat protein
MRRLRFRLTIRRLALLIVLVALGLLGWRVYREGSETHWLVLKLRYGNAQTRRATAKKLHDQIAMGMLQSMFGIDPLPVNPREREDYLDRRQERGDLLMAALLRAAADRDPGCRAMALNAAGALALLRPNDVRNSQVLRLALIALRDPEGVVRTAGIEQLLSLAQPSTALEAFKAALSDPAFEVRMMAIRQLGGLGYVARETQTEVAEILASEKDERVRVAVVWAMSMFGKDYNRDTAGPDVVPSLLDALRDPEVKVRRVAAYNLSSTQTQTISAWTTRKDAIIPAARKAMKDTDEEVRDYAAVALFCLGERDPEMTPVLEEGTRSTNSNRSRRCREALDAWKAELEAAVLGDPALDQRDGNGPQ